MEVLIMNQSVQDEANEGYRATATVMRTWWRWRLLLGLSTQLRRRIFLRFI